MPRRRSFPHPLKGERWNSLLRPLIEKHKLVYIFSAIDATPSDHVVPRLVETHHIRIAFHHHAVTSRAVPLRFSCSFTSNMY